ncbi:MAG: restriction endonuclease subunit S, partial [Candidatus Aenigmarchaeota archaeon]|nr:restriction endonuclease subunit S [Candidatus Aenigmarchaeota archaeon]
MHNHKVPDGWRRLKIGDIAQVGRGASPRPIQDPKWFADSGIGWIRIEDVTSSRKYIEKTKQYLSEEGVSKSVFVDRGDLIMSICGTIGRPMILNMQACIHDGFVV